MSNPQEKNLAEGVVDGLRDVAEAGGIPVVEKTEEEKKISAIKEAAKRDIIRRATEYIQTRPAERHGKKHLIREIQEIVDTLQDAFVLVVPQKDGVPYSITFNPGEKAPEDTHIPAADSPSQTDA